ncbi:DUF2391 family protein [Neolewinella agarilytica]|nr:DUF2391 family protein [Neolewinella agarilytica]
MPKLFAISPLTDVITEGDTKTPLYKVDLRNLSRAFCGALFLALPLHFTMEMWARARVIPAWALVLIIIACYFINVGFAFYSGFKGKTDQQVPWLDALSSMGIGLAASVITLLLIDQIGPEMSVDIILSCIALEMVPTSFGASLAKSQLGSGDSNDSKDLTKNWSRDKTKMIASLLGGIMFAFNVGATQEPITIATSAKSLQMIGIILFSLFVSYLMIFMTEFEENEEDAKGIMGPSWAETVICYAISLVVSAALLWMFGYLTPETPLSVLLPWIVVLGYATTLGGSAGRLVI